jgi:hypothetical protein
MGVRGGGRTALNWSAYDANGQAMHLGIADVLDESLPRLAPLLKANNVKVGPGTTIWAAATNERFTAEALRRCPVRYG